MDGALIERAREGDADAFDELARERMDSMYATALAILGNPADARDATQEALVAAWRSIASLREPAKLDGWLYRITINSARMVARRRRPVREIRPLETVDLERPSIDDSDTISAGDFDRAFEALTVEQRALLVAHHFDGIAVDELGRRFGVPAGTIKSRLYAARQALERALNGAD